MEARQLVPTSDTDGQTSRARLCQAVNLPANGVLVMPGGEIITLSGPASFKPACTANTQPAIIAGTGGGGNGGVSLDETAQIGPPSFSDLSDPFYASTFPQCYALAATTVIAYTLVIMLVITPRSFLDGGLVVLGRRGFTSGGSGSGTIGGRPWLQKVAALTVAVSLTIATADTFRVAEEQYALGLQDARDLQNKVLNGTELKIIRIISDTFLWLAQAQTLIRLFPRQREKVIIKWTAFALITFDLIFDSLNSFQYGPGPGNTRPGSFTDAIPALSYLFQLALGVLYAAWVIYYSLMKKRYAYYHPQMKNISLVAALSLFAILVPVVFFILDISKPEFIGWGDYVRWVGAAAASVIVWEWVERIEALEREEKRDGILGREVFDGDEMLETPSDLSWPRRHRTEKPPEGRPGADDDGAEDGQGGEPNLRSATVGGRSSIWPTVSAIATRYRPRSRPAARMASMPAAETAPGSRTSTHARPSTRFLQPPLWPSRPPPALTPISRTDTASADSTVYAIRYHPLTETTSRTTAHPPLVRSPSPSPGLIPSGPVSSDTATASQSGDSPQPRSHSEPHAGRRPPRSDNGAASVPLGSGACALSVRSGEAAGLANETSSVGHGNRATSRLHALAHVIPFRRAPRAETETLGVGGPGRPIPQSSSNSEQSQQTRLRRAGQTTRWDLRSRMEDYAATQAERLRERIRPTPDTDNLPVTVIPAPARRGAALTQLLEEEELRIDEHSPSVSGADSQNNHLTRSLAGPSPPPPPRGTSPRRRNSTESTRSISMQDATIPPSQSTIASSPGPDSHTPQSENGSRSLVNRQSVT